MATVKMFPPRKRRVPSWHYLAGLVRWRSHEPARVIPIYSQRRGKKFSARVTLPAK